MNGINFHITVFYNGNGRFGVMALQKSEVRVGMQGRSNYLSRFPQMDAFGMVPSIDVGAKRKSRLNGGKEQKYR